MPVLIAPSITTVPTVTGGKGRYCVRAAYDFGGQTPGPQNLGGVSFNGSTFTLDVSAIKSPINLNTPAFRSMVFAASFVTTQEGGIAGALIVYVPATGQVMRFGPALQDAVPSSGSIVQTISGCVPVVTNSPSVIVLGKEIDSIGDATSGTVQVTLFDFDLPAWISSGNANNA